jgi:hypothetical protein
MGNTIDQNLANKVAPVNTELAQMNMDEAQQVVRAKASWFFWVAGLSIINIFLAAKGVSFVVGLAISQVIDILVLLVTGNRHYFISLLAPLLFATFGYFAFKLQRWAFIIGAIVYIIDGMIYLFFNEWLAFGIHLFVLYNLYKGYREITEYELQLAKLN